MKNFNQKTRYSICAVFVTYFFTSARETAGFVALGLTCDAKISDKACSRLHTIHKYPVIQENSQYTLCLNKNAPKFGKL